MNIKFHMKYYFMVHQTVLTFLMVSNLNRQIQIVLENRIRTQFSSHL